MNKGSEIIPENTEYPLPKHEHEWQTKGGVNTLIGPNHSGQRAK